MATPTARPTTTRPATRSVRAPAAPPGADRPRARASSVTARSNRFHHPARLGLGAGGERLGRHHPVGGLGGEGAQVREDLLLVGGQRVGAGARRGRGTRTNVCGAIHSIADVAPRREVEHGRGDGVAVDLPVAREEPDHRGRLGRRGDRGSVRPASTSRGSLRDRERGQQRDPDRRGRPRDDPHHVSALRPGSGASVASAILNTRIAFSRRNFGQTSSLNGTLGRSANWRSSVRPAGK